VPVKIFVLTSRIEQLPSASGPERRRLTRAAAAVACATVLSRVLGFARDALIAWTFGASFSSDAFLAAFRIPNLFRRLVGEGTLNSAFVPVFTEALWKEGHARADALFSSASRLLSGLLLLMCVSGMLAAPWIVQAIAPGFLGSKLDLTILLTRMMFPYIIAGGLAALCMGALNVYGSFAAPALGPAVLNLVMIGSMLAIDPGMDQPVVALAVGVLCGGAAQLVWQAPFLRRHGLHLWRYAAASRGALMRMARLTVPAVLGGAVYQINVLVGTLLASLLAEGSVSYLYYAERLVEFPLGVVAMAGATAALPSLSRQAASGDIDAVGETCGYALRLVSFVSIPAMAGLLVLGEPIVALLFQRGEFGADAVRLTAQALSYYALGIWAFASARIVVTVFLALQDAGTLVRAAAWSLLANILLAVGLMKPLAHCGMALAASLSSILNLALLLAALRGKPIVIDWRLIGSSVWRSCVGALVMSPGALTVFKILIPDLSEVGAGRLSLGVVVSIIAGALIYAAAALAMRSPELEGLLAHLRRKVHLP
jgi:putative peptidoglycan lipid II flippase